MHSTNVATWTRSRCVWTARRFRRIAFVFELLPDKLAHVHSDPDVSPFLVGRQHPLEWLNIFVNRMHLCCPRIHRWKASKFTLVSTASNDDEWLARWFPKYSNALRCLHTINAELKLKLIDWYTSFNHFHGADEIAEKVDEKLVNIRSFLGFAATVGIGIESICVHINVFFESKYEDLFAHSLLSQFERGKWRTR
ncbi:hypothetical protein M3Y99_01824100 [Aphelenchoides fujianensis]|nr:hypothetical protein M3Y99_01824100 [Aphelenchoides fujianensis]